MIVKNMRSYKGNFIANQFIIVINDMTIFQSYDSTIAIVYRNGDIVLDEVYWDYSRTTAKYRNKFLNLDTSEINSRIKDGSITLANLNNILGQ